MFFVTVGQTLPFDRLVRLVDGAVGEGLFTPDEVFAQIGWGDYIPRHVPYQRFLEPSACARRFAAATAVIGHAGVGTVMHAIAQGKPLVAVPRRASQGECVDDHQVRMAELFAGLGHILTAEDVSGLAEQLERAPSFVPRPRRPRIGPLCERLASFVRVCAAQKGLAAPDATRSAL